MKYLLLVLLLVAGFNSQAQSPKPLTETELDSTYRKDKLNGTLLEWSKSDVKDFRHDCEKQLAGKVTDPKAFCSCAQIAVAENLNYSTFLEQSTYQQGRTLGYLSKDRCR